MTDPLILTMLSAAVCAVTLVFISVFALEPWWRSPFGRAVMVFAVAVVVFQGLTLARFFFGSEYPGRDVILGCARGLVLLAVVQQLWVLIKARRR